MRDHVAGDGACKENCAAYAGRNERLAANGSALLSGGMSFFHRLDDVPRYEAEGDD